MPIRFDTDSDIVQRRGRQTLEQAAEAVRNHYRYVVIQGNCSLDEAMRDPSSGDELSFRRALAVRRVLESYGIAKSRLRIVVCGPHEKLNDLKVPDRQVALVTLGSYYLPTEMDVIDDRDIDSLESPGDKKKEAPSGH
jgi:outer membrane protein OmpA-like peptidoglycan-associated protein